MEVTKEALYKGTEQAKAGNRVGDISAAVQEYAERFGYGVVREWRDTAWVGKCTKTRVSPTTEHAAEDPF